MHEAQLLHTYLKKSCPMIHSARLSSLIDGVGALIRGNKLNTTGLGRASSSPVATKHQIKKMDYLVGNRKLHNERINVYHFLAKALIANNKRPHILIDWSNVTPCGRFHMLSACICAAGRAMMIYNEVHQESDYGKEAVHKAFLSSLRKVIGKAINPIIITDAGYRNTWFKAVTAMEWDWVGRVRHKTLMQQDSGTPWQPCKDTYSAATTRPKYLGKVTLAKTNPIECHLHIVKDKPKGRSDINCKGKVSRCSQSRQHAKGATDPWLIATSLSPEEYNAFEVIGLYRKRMQIEETFRDLKNSRNGFAFSESKTQSSQRFEILLLIASLAMFALRVIGTWAMENNYQSQFQANTIRHRNVLSVISLAKEVLRKKHLRIPWREVARVFKQISVKLEDLPC